MTRPWIRTHVLDAAADAHCTEFLYDDGENDAVLACAAHGGAVEPGTAEAAIELATRLPAASCWAVMGYVEDGEAFDRYHPPSTGFDPAEYPLLAEVADRGFETVVSLHGLADEGVIVGGGAPGDRKELVADRLAAALERPVQTADGGAYGGVHPDNFVNWLAAGEAGGIQVEMGPTTRAEGGETVVSVLESLVTAGRI